MTLYGTTDLIFAAYLVSKGHKLAEISKQGNTGTFYFDDVAQIEQLDYDQGYGSIEPVEFSNNIKRLTQAVRRM